MTLEECYRKMEGNYEDVMGRLKSERLVQKFVLKFLDDGSFSLLMRSLEEKNGEEAFRAAHTIKGMCQNLSFEKLEKSDSELTELLRGGNSEVPKELLDRVRADYEATISAICEFKESLN